MEFPSSDLSLECSEGVLFSAGFSEAMMIS